MIYIFLENLILYLRINLGVDSNEQKKDEDIISNRSKKDNNNKKEKENNEINKTDEDNIKENSNIKNNIYSDKFLTYIKKNKKLNLEFSFYKHLNKFSYLFKYKGIQYCSDFSYLSDKYIITDESVFFEFLDQVYSFLYYVVPKTKGFELSYSIINENKIKIFFQKTNCPNKGGYRLKKIRRDNSGLVFEDKFRATNTVKTSQMTKEVLYKLSELLGIKLKIMEYEEEKENIYLTIILPFFYDEDNDLVDQDINEFPVESSGKISTLAEVAGRNILNGYNNENPDNENMEIKNLEEDIKFNNNEITDKNNSKPKININTNNNQNCWNFNINKKKISTFIEQVDEKNSSEEDISSIKEEEKEKENNNNNFNTKKRQSNNSSLLKSCSSISKTSMNNAMIKKKAICKSKSCFSDFNNISKKNNCKELSVNCLKELKQNQIENNLKLKDNQINNNNNNTSPQNLLTLIHQKYSNIEKLRSRGVEILTENESEKDNENDNENKINSFHLETIDSYDDNTSFKDKKSLSVEIDSDNYIEFENDSGDENEIDCLKIDENGFCPNKANNHKKKSNMSLLLNINNNSALYSSPKNNRTNSSTFEANKPSNKTLNYNKKDNDSLFVIPEINEGTQKDLTALSIPKKDKNKNTPSSFKCTCKDILVVDDDEFILKTSKNILKSFKLQADFAENGQECLNKIKEKQKKNCNCSKNKYKLVLMDITMPIMDGIEAAKNIQKMIDEHQLYDSIKIIFISAHVNLDLSSTLSGIKCAIDYYAKPISGVKYKALLDKYYYSK